MDELSEKEQWDQLKGWVRSNGPQVLVMVAIMLSAWYGWKWWQGRGEQQTQAASTAYQTIISRFDDHKEAEALALIETLRGEYPQSPYVAAADMVAARVLVEGNELDKAVERLQRVASSAPDEKLRPVAKVRLARVQIAQGKYDAALATLGTGSLGTQEPARLEARGDVLLAKGERAKALAEYEAARKLQPATVDETASADVDSTQLLDLKIADLKGSAPTPASVPATTSAPAPAAKP